MHGISRTKYALRIHTAHVAKAVPQCCIASLDTLVMALLMMGSIQSNSSFIYKEENSPGLKY